MRDTSTTRAVLEEHMIDSAPIVLAIEPLCDAIEVLTAAVNALAERVEELESRNTSLWNALR